MTYEFSNNCEHVEPDEIVFDFTLIETILCEIS